jgi:hypothetical protein
MNPTDDLALREELGRLLEGGLQTDWHERAYTTEAIDAVVRRLRAVDKKDYRGLLRVGGFTPAAYRAPEDADLEQECATCMYFERNRQFCNLPELDLPVRPEWSCVLWRI